MSLTYGSFGDIITTVQLAGRLWQALSDSRGSAREFRDLVVELRVFHRVLDSLLLFWQSRKQCPELDTLAEIIRPVMLDCQATIKAFLDKAITRYGRGLIQPTGSKRSFNDIRKMIQWNLLETEKVTQLRDKLRRAKDTIDLVHHRAQEIIQEYDQSVVDERLDSIITLEYEVAENVDKRLDELVEKVLEQNRTLTRVDNNIESMLSQMTSMTTEVYTMRSSVNNIDNGMELLLGSLRSLNLTSQNILYLEDALGWVVPIPLDIIRSWDTVDSIIRDRFRDHPGLELVSRRRYILQDDTTGRDIKRSTPFYIASRPKQRLNMVMVLHAWQDYGSQANGRQHKNETICPRCHYTDIIERRDPDEDIKCKNPRCGLLYRRVIDISRGLEEESDRLELASSATSRSIGDDNEGRLIGTDLVESILASQKDTPVFGLDDFKRARFLTNWWYLDESRGAPFRSTLEDVHFWNLNLQCGFAQMTMQQFLSFLRFKTADSGYLENDPERDDLREDILVQDAIYWNLCFVGRRKKDARLVLMIASRSRRVRQLALEVAREFLPKSSHILAIEALPDMFWTQDEWVELCNVAAQSRYRGVYNLSGLNSDTEGGSYIGT